jgi:hypothetical protein
MNQVVVDMRKMVVNLVSAIAALAVTGCKPEAYDGDTGSGIVDPQSSWDHLTTEALVIAGDPLFVRIATDDAEIRMPPGSSGLPPGAVCSIGTWIADGAEFVP